MNGVRFPRAIALLSLLLLTAPLAQAKAPAGAMPVQNPRPATAATPPPPADPAPSTMNANLKDAFYHLPIPGIKNAMDSLFSALRKGESGGYGAQTTIDIPNVGKVPLQLYFFGKAEKQVLMLVVDSSIEIPKVFNNHAWQKLAGAKLSDPIFTVSTTDFMLATREMPPDYQKVVLDSYFNVGALSFTSGFQVAARIQLG
jgi:hypothetical protein